MRPLENWIVGGYHFGQMTFYHKQHAGIDLRAYKDAVFAPFDGEIIREWTGYEGGKTLWFTPTHGIKLTNGEIVPKVIMRFMHLDHYEAPMGHVSMGTRVAVTDNTGALSQAPHLHLDVSRNEVLLGSIDNFIDPEQIDWSWNGAEAVLVSATPEPADFWITVTVNKLNVRTAPSTGAQLVPNKQLRLGDKVRINGVVSGSEVDGNNTWLHTAVSGLYIWAGGSNYKHQQNNA